jgi:hypothetical protein
MTLPDGRTTYDVWTWIVGWQQWFVDVELPRMLRRAYADLYVDERQGSPWIDFGGEA